MLYSNFLLLSIIRIITLPLYIACYTILAGKPKKGLRELENFGQYLAFHSAVGKLPNEAICERQ